MKKTLLLDTNATGNTLGDPLVIDPHKGPMCIVYDISGTTGDQINIAVGKRLDNQLSPLGAKAESIANWYYDDASVVNKAANTGGLLRIAGNYNGFIGYVSGNADGKRVRIWLVYN